MIIPLTILKKNPWSNNISFTQKYDSNICRFLPLLTSILSSNYFVMRVFNHKFNSLVFQFKLTHPYSSILMILTSHHLPVQTHHNDFRPTFCNFFGKCEENQSKLLGIIVTLLQWVWARSVVGKLQLTRVRCKLILLYSDNEDKINLLVL